MVKIVFAILIVLLIPLHTFAHSGGTDAKGCHKNRKTGETHCHNKKLKPPENKNSASSSERKLSIQQKNNHIRHWIDEKGEIHYSNNIKDVPASSTESMNAK